MSVTMLQREERTATIAAASAGRELSAPRKRVRTSYKMASRLLTILPPVLLGLVILGSWSFSTSRSLVPAYELPAPADVWSALWDGLNQGLFQNMAWITIQESLGGFLLAMLLALPLGYSLTKWRLFAATVQPYLAAGQAIPAIVIAPFLVFWMGYGLGPIMVLCFLVVFFPMVVTTALGFSTIDASLREAANVEGASFWPLLVHVELPLSLPAIMAAIRTGLTLSIVGALVGEFVMNADRGLGALVQIAKNQYDVSLMFATIIILAVMAAIFYGLAWGLTRLSETISM
ncbi:MAG TPA: ABC transporter permease [Ktedonobacteraceae bacterium]|nr:ABC transporter permease [Ktedonobacteraceae bacterium]